MDTYEEHNTTLNETSIIKPNKLLVFYNNGYIESSDLDDMTFMPKSFKPLTNKEILNLFSYLNKAKNKVTNNTLNESYSFKGYINRQILELEIDESSISMSWVVPSKVRVFNYYNETSEINYPGIILRLHQNNLYAYSYKSTYKENSLLYRTPLPNIGSDGSLCFGNVNLKKLISKNLTKTIEKIEFEFFNSSFTHENCKSSKTDMKKLLRKQMKTKDKFPSSEFIKHKKNFKDVISS